MLADNTLPCTGWARHGSARCELQYGHPGPCTTARLAAARRLVVDAQLRTTDEGLAQAILLILDELEQRP